VRKISSGPNHLFLPLRDHRHLQPKSRGLARRRRRALFKPLFEDAAAKHGVLPGQLTLHADRGAAMKAKATALLLGVTKSLQISASVPPALRLHPGRQGLPPPVLRLVQSRPPPSRNRPDDAKPGPLPTGRRGLRRTTENSRQSLQRQSKPLRQKAPKPPQKPTTVWINPPKMKPEIQA
jgi:putative transposase